MSIDYHVMMTMGRNYQFNGYCGVLVSRLFTSTYTIGFPSPIEATGKPLDHSFSPSFPAPFPDIRFPPSRPESLDTGFNPSSLHYCYSI